MAGIETLAIIDLEGTDLPDDSGILELHCRLVDRATLKERGCFWALPELPPGARPLNDFTRAMHEKNGLLRRRDTLGLSIWHTSAGADTVFTWASNARLVPLAIVEEHLVAWLRRHHGDDGARSVIMTGNSIANYDIPLLRRWMPGIFAAMHYRIYDVSVVRTHYREVLGQPLPPDVERQITGDKSDDPHRAADDTLTCLKTMRQLRTWARNGAGAAPSEEDAGNDGWDVDWTHPSDTKGRV